MARTLTIDNNLTDYAQRTYITNPTVAGGTSIPVRNINGGVASWAIQLGETGQEKSEILLLGTATPSGTALNTTGTTRFDHPTDTPIYFIQYDKVVVKRASGTANTAIALTDGTVSITPDSKYTLFEDSGGSDDYVYRVSFYNSVTADETGDSDWILGSGSKFYSLGKIRERAKSRIFNTGFIANDDLVNDWINEWLEYMNNAAIQVNDDFSMGTVDIGHGTDGFATITQEDFKEVRRVEFTTNGTDWYLAKKMHITDFYPGEVFNNTHPYYYMRGNDVICKKPDGDSGTVRLAYYNLVTFMDSDGDKLPLPMRSYTRSFVHYALSQAYYLDNKGNEGDRELAIAESDANKFIDQITPRGKGGANYIKLEEAIDGDDDLVLF